MSIKKLAVCLALAGVVLPCAGALSAPTACGVGLTQDPLVMRLGQDEFRIAFGLDGATCGETGCSGSIAYDATWETEDGARSTERKRVAFQIPGGAARSLTVDRSYFDTGEARHTTRIVGVGVAQISCDASPAAGLAKK